MHISDMVSHGSQWFRPEYMFVHVWAKSSTGTYSRPLVDHGKWCLRKPIALDSERKDSDSEPLGTLPGQTDHVPEGGDQAAEDPAQQAQWQQATQMSSRSPRRPLSKINVWRTYQKRSDQKAQFLS